MIFNSKKLNNKGYLLIEIILSSALAISMGYFLVQLTLKAKNTNDDLLVRTIVSADQGIIYNKLMSKVANGTFVSSKLTKDGQKIKYNDEVINILSDYAKIGDIENDSSNNIIIIPISVQQLPNENFDVIIYLN